jgi:DNA-binding winged helix-turn-helix (wHTH) protein/tetratricopeptide (TPR) repeat protein
MTQPAVKSRQTYSFEDFTLDLERGSLFRGAEEVKLRPKVFEALKYLVLHDNVLVSKDELIRALWPDSFVTDDSLVQCMVELRRALGEAAACLKTVPRRGYVFTARVTRAEPAAPPAPAVEPVPAPAPVAARRARPMAAALVLALVAAASLYFVTTRAPSRTVAFTERDSVLIADFANTTGDDVFDGTLRHAMAVQLGQSPYLNVFPEERVRETLRYMGQPPDQPVTRDLAREIAQRQGVKAILAGSIASLGRHYVINLEAVNAATGESFLREQVEAESREKVLGRLGEAAARLRESLGESVASIEKFAAPIEQATTPSLEAFKAYDLGRQKHFSGRYFEAIPLYRRAVELDPGFAIAYAALAISYGTAREDDLAAQFAERAFALRERVTERERFYISARYYVDVLGDGDKAIEVLELWKQTYPRDFVPRTNLSARYAAIGQHERGLAEAQEALRLNPDAGVAYAAVAYGLICLDRYGEAREALDAALARQLEPPYSRYMLYGIALLEGDADAMRQQVDRAAGTPTEAGMLAMRSVAAASAGQVRQARDLTERAIALATSRGLKEGAGLYSASEALWEAAYGRCGAARRATTRTLDLSRNRHAVSWSALALALCGETAAAERLFEEMGRRFPADSFVRTSWMPMAQAALEIHRGRPARAVERLEPAARVELGSDAVLWPAYLRGQALLAQGAGAEAQAEFQKILDHKGVIAPKDFNPAGMALYPLAHLGRARAALRLGDVEASRQAYEAALSLWKDADADLPVLRSGPAPPGAASPSARSSRASTGDRR